MQWEDIRVIYKIKGTKLELENEQGIFIVNSFRSVLLKLVYADKYKIVNENMSDSNVSAKKNRNHRFSLSGIINDVVNNREKCLDLIIVD